MQHSLQCLALKLSQMYAMYFQRARLPVLLVSAYSGSAQLHLLLHLNKPNFLSAVKRLIHLLSPSNTAANSAPLQM